MLKITETRENEALKAYALESHKPGPKFHHFQAVTLSNICHISQSYLLIYKVKEGKKMRSSKSHENEKQIR